MWEGREGEWEGREFLVHISQLQGLDEGGGPSPYANPGAISSSSSANGEGATGGRSGASKGEAIWSEEEVGEGGGQDYDDPREEPE